MSDASKLTSQVPEWNEEVVLGVLRQQLAEAKVRIEELKREPPDRNGELLRELLEAESLERMINQAERKAEEPAP